MRIQFVILVVAMLAIYLGERRLRPRIVQWEHSHLIVVWRDQLVFVLLLAALAQLFIMMKFAFLGKLAMSGATVAFIFFLWENFDRHVVRTDLVRSGVRIGMLALVSAALATPFVT